MSLNRKKELIEIAKVICRGLRKNSTPAEMKFWSFVRDRKFLNRKFYRQFPFFYDLTGKESFFVADFYCNEIKTIIELDGIIHKFKLADDKNRTEILNDLGLRVIRITNKEVEENIEGVLEKLKTIM